jgi:predicted dinucleotide-binding enzyme
MRRPRAPPQQPTEEKNTVTPADVCDAIKFCDVIAQVIPWGKVGAAVAALALTYGVTMSIALVVYVYRFRGQRRMRR